MRFVARIALAVLGVSLLIKAAPAAAQGQVNPYRVQQRYNDAIEIFNPRVAMKSFNEEAARFAAKYRIPAGAGSDSHVPQGLGSVRIAMRDFDGPEEFLESLRDADIIRRKQSLLYVQALKLLQTKAPGAAPKASRRRSATAARRAGSRPRRGNK